MKVACAGEARGRPADFEISLDEEGLASSGPTGRAFRSGRAVVGCDFMAASRSDPRHERTRKPGFAAAASFPFKERGRTVAVLTLYAPTRAAFTEDLLSTLGEIIPGASSALDGFAREAARRKAEEAQAAILNALPAHVALLDSRGVIAAVNEGWRRFAIANQLRAVDYGVGQNYLQVCDAAGDLDEAPRVAQGLREVLGGGRSEFAVEYACHSPEAERWFRLTAAPLRKSGDGAVVMHIDVTRRKIIEDALRRSEIEQRRLAERLIEAQAVGKVGSWEIDAPTMEVRWSDQMHRIHETSPDAFHPSCSTWLARIHPEDRDAVDRVLDDALREGLPSAIEHRILLPDGTTKDVEERWRGFRDDGGRVGRIVGTCHDVTERKRAAEALERGAARMEQVSRRLLRAQEDERRRIARELHDEVGQALTALKLDLQGVLRGDEDATRTLIESVALVDQTLQQVRNLALDLRPSILDDLGLTAALGWYVQRHARRTGLHGSVATDPDDLRAHPEIETVCFRIAQEALTNVARHARATRFSVELLQHARGLQLVIRDDGIGFDPQAALRAATRGASLGLTGMRERVELVGGSFAVVSEPGQGAEVQADLPNAPRAAVESYDPRASK